MKLKSMLIHPTLEKKCKKFQKTASLIKQKEEDFLSYGFGIKKTKPQHLNILAKELQELREKLPRFTRRDMKTGFNTKGFADGDICPYCHSNLRRISPNIMCPNCNFIGNIK